MSRPRASIFLNGTAPSADLIKKHCLPEDLMICTDGAYDYLMRYGMHPDILIGDMDSVSRLPDRQDIRIIKTADPMNNDLEKALRFCLDEHIAELNIFGADGKRLDHFIINLATLASYAGKMDITIFSEKEQLHFLIPGQYAFTGCSGKRFSLLSLKTAAGLTLKGAAYPLTDTVLEPGSLGLSNAFTADTLQISFKSGLLLYMTE